MTVLALGLNYRSAPLSLRERLAIAAEAMPDALADIRRVAGVREAAILSTCNRTEIFTVGGGADQLGHWLSRRADLSPAELQPHLFTYDQPRAVRHALRVAAGLDSMILGEPQILGQMKGAYHTALRQRSLGPVLARLFQHSFRIAKQVRTQTAIGSRPVSVAAAAATLTQEIFADLRGREVLIIGAGDTARLVTEHLFKLGAPRITVANRHPERARHLAERFQGASCGLEGIEMQLASADVVVSTVATQRRLIDRALTRRAFAMRKRKAVLMVDLGVPRNIDPDVSKDQDIYLYTVDDLQAVTEHSRAQREAAAEAAGDIIESGTRDFLDWLELRRNVNAIRRLRRRTETQAEELLAQAQRQLRAGVAPEEVLRRFSHSLTRQFLHHPTLSLRRLSGRERDARLAEISELFDLDDGA